MTVHRPLRRWSQRITAAALTVGILAGSVGPGLAAAQATPEATPGQRGGLACRGEPITPERFIAALDAAATTAATPTPLERITLETLPAGEPADQATVEAITETVQTVLNCRNAGDFPRVFALFSDRMLGLLYGSRETVPPEIIEQLQTAPRRIRPAFRVNLVELSNVSLLPDGRAGAVVVTANATHTFTDYLSFVNEDGRWLIDQAVAISTTQLEATPVP